ncbi:hypothetical protein [Citricoccus sp. K5]|nr:hypothetical protein [Citricoccus sp. K5]VXB80953.1 hypothetical protein CITRIK5_60372 [Citricoccus sp. K5]
MTRLAAYTQSNLASLIHPRTGESAFNPVGGLETAEPLVDPEGARLRG